MTSMTSMTMTTMTTMTTLSINNDDGSSRTHPWSRMTIVELHCFFNSRRYWQRRRPPASNQLGPGEAPCWPRLWLSLSEWALGGLCLGHEWHYSLQTFYLVYTHTLCLSALIIANARSLPRAHVMSMYHGTMHAILGVGQKRSRPPTR